MISAWLPYDFLTPQSIRSIWSVKENVTHHSKFPGCRDEDSERIGRRAREFQVEYRGYLYVHRVNPVRLTEGGCSRWSPARPHYVDRSPGCPIPSSAQPPARSTRFHREAVSGHRRCEPGRNQSASLS